MSGQKLVSWQKDGVGCVLQNIAYGECRPNQTGLGRSCSMNYVEGSCQSRLVVQTPKMYVPFGAKEWEARESGKPNKWDLVMSFKGNTVPMNMFSQLIQAIDEANVTYAYENQEAFFSEKGKSRDIILDRYTPIYNNSNPKYEPKLGTRLDFRNGAYTGQVYDPSGVQQDIDFVTPHCYVQALVEFGSLWVADKRFGQTIRTIQMMVHKQDTIRTLAITPMELDDPPVQGSGGDHAAYEEYTE